MTDTIHIALNGERFELPPRTSLAALIEFLGLDAGAISTAVNRAFVARSERAGFVLTEGDAVQCFGPITGG